MGFLFFGGGPRSSTASVQVALLGGGDFSLCLAPAKLGSHQSFHSNPLCRCREQPPASPSGWELSGLGAFTGCLAFLLRFHIFSSPPRRHPGPGCSSPGAPATHPHLPPLPSAPQKAAAVPAVPRRGLRGAGDGVISLGPLSPGLGQRRQCRARPCHPLPLPVPSGSQLRGPARQPVALVLAARAAMLPAGRPPSPPPADSKRLRLWGEKVALWWGGLLGEVGSHQQPPCWLWDAPHRPRPRDGSRTPTRCLCGTWRGSGWWGAAVTPLWGVSPTHPPFSTAPPLPCREPLTQAGV